MVEVLASPSLSCPSPVFRLSFELLAFSVRPRLSVPIRPMLAAEPLSVIQLRVSSGLLALASTRPKSSPVASKPIAESSLPVATRAAMLLPPITSKRALTVSCEPPLTVSTTLAVALLTPALADGLTTSAPTLAPAKAPPKLTR